MPEYIKRESAKRLFADSHDYGLARKLDEIPAADVVEVVRCRDCKFCRAMSNKRSGINWLNCKLWCADIDGDDFCSYAERKKDGVNV